MSAWQYLFLFCFFSSFFPSCSFFSPLTLRLHNHINNLQYTCPIQSTTNKQQITTTSRHTHAPPPSLRQSNNNPQLLSFFILFFSISLARSHASLSSFFFPLVSRSVFLVRTFLFSFYALESRTQKKSSDHPSHTQSFIFFCLHLALPQWTHLRPI